MPLVIFPGLLGRESRPRAATVGDFCVSRLRAAEGWPRLLCVSKAERGNRTREQSISTGRTTTVTQGEGLSGDTPYLRIEDTGDVFEIRGAVTTVAKK